MNIFSEISSAFPQALTPRHENPNSACDLRCKPYRNRPKNWGHPAIGSAFNCGKASPGAAQVRRDYNGRWATVLLINGAV